MLAQSLASAVTYFHDDYGYLPTLPAPGAYPNSPVELETDTARASGLVQILLGMEPDGGYCQNVRNTNYLEGMKAAKLAEGGPRAGLILDVSTDTFAVVDAWGHPFRVRLNARGQPSGKRPGVRPPEKFSPPQFVEVISPGKDGNFDTLEDNISSLPE